MRLEVVYCNVQICDFTVHADKLSTDAFGDRCHILIQHQKGNAFCSACAPRGQKGPGQAEQKRQIDQDGAKKTELKCGAQNGGEKEKPNANQDAIWERDTEFFGAQAFANKRNITCFGGGIQR